MNISQRTRNRFREHGDHWKPIEARKLSIFGGQDAVLFSCEDNCSWLGWIPLAEAKEVGALPECFKPVDSTDSVRLGFWS